MSENSVEKQRRALYVLKRDGNEQPVRFDKVTDRIKLLCCMQPPLDSDVIDPSEVAQAVIRGIFPGVKTTELDNLAAETAAYRSQQHPHYDKLAARLTVSNLHKETSGDVIQVLRQLHDYVNATTGQAAPMIDEPQFRFALRNEHALRKAVKYNRDYRYNYFGYKTLERSYLLRCDGKIVERPQDMLMRVAIGIHYSDEPSKDAEALADVLQTYDMLSRGLFIHATPTLFNAATPRAQMSSCFLVMLEEDSIDGIYSTLKKCALISKSAGGIGISVSNVRAAGSYIRGTNGHSNGLVPMLRVFNDTARYVDQCFMPQTLVCTRHGPRAIAQLEIGDEVLTAAGTFEQVERVLKHTYTGPMLEINVQKSRKVLVTPEHQVLALQGQATEVNVDALRNRLDNHCAKAQMVDARDLRVGDFVCYPVGNDAAERQVHSVTELPPSAGDAACLVHDGMMYSRICAINVQTRETEIVYDLEVANEHTYVTEMGAVHNGGGKRKGAFAIYLEPWHADVFDFLELKRNHGSEERRARDLFYALWIPDLFMKRVEADEDWSLFCPTVAKRLCDTHGAEFERLYVEYEQQGKQMRTVRAQDLWRAIVESQIETGTPYMLYKDACNAKSNQQHLGTIRSSNLCSEIVEYTAPDEIAVCNLASLALPKFVNVDEQTFDHRLLAKVVGVVTRNLNKIIDRNHYPVEEARNSNMKHRPIGLGVQGLADVFLLLRMPFDSDEARQLNREIFETIYYAALDASCKLAEQSGRPYASFAGSPLSEGKFQFDLWHERPESERRESAAFGRWNWQALRRRVMQSGVANSLFVAPMPTASTSQILGNNECIEPYTSNVYVRRALAGEFTVINKHLVRDLSAIGLWNSTVRNEIVRQRGSVQRIDSVPDDLKRLYRTVWEISQRSLIDMAADRGIYIDQSQSFNVHLAQPSFGVITSMHFYAWKKGLKTGMYYLRTKPAVDAIQFTVNKNVVTKTSDVAAGEHCSMQDGCVSCGS